MLADMARLCDVTQIFIRLGVYLPREMLTRLEILHSPRWSDIGDGRRPIELITFALDTHGRSFGARHALQ